MEVDGDGPVVGGGDEAEPGEEGEVADRLGVLGARAKDGPVAPDADLVVRVETVLVLPTGGTRHDVAVLESEHRDGVLVTEKPQVGLAREHIPDDGRAVPAP